MDLTISRTAKQKQFFSVACTVELWVDVDPSWDEEEVLGEVRYQACVGVYDDWCRARVYRAQERFRWPWRVRMIRRLLRHLPKLARELATYTQ